jgi:hypothetical protein
MPDRARDDDPTRDPAEGFDPDGFDRELRALGFEAHQVLARPDATTEELVALHWRAWSLLHQPGGDQAPEADRWVLAIRRAIVDRLADWAREQFESGAA